MSDQFTKQRICPCKPVPRKDLRVIHVVALMNEPRSGRAGFQHSKHSCNLRFRCTGERIDNLRHGPDAASSNVWPSHAFTRSAAKEPWIRTAPDKNARA